MAQKTKFVRIGVEGATTDGRKIERKWIEQMARRYSPATFGARVNLEHYRGVLPDGPFKAYGDVIALKASDITEGDLKGKLALYAQIDPTADLITLNKARQKVYTSMEVNPDFADTGEAYLVGLAVTDDPASLGTEMLTFASQATANPFAARKQSPGNLFSAAIEAELEFLDEEPTDADGRGLFTKVRELLFSSKAGTEAKFAETHKAVELLADNQRELAEQLAEFKGLPAEHKALKAAHDKLQGEYSALVAKLDKQPDPNFTQRPPATGAEGGGFELTDC